MIIVRLGKGEKMGPCPYYDCTNRNSFGYCKTTACINPNYNHKSLTVDAEPTEEQVKEYCHKRHLVMVNSELFNEMKTRWSGETVKHGHWIPVKFRPMDSEEREYWEEQFGEELADADAVLFDCPMPEDGQEILVSYRKWISMDKCEIDDGGYGLEGNGDWDGVIAWMPQPKPYEVEE